MVDGRPRLPDWLVVGAQKSGTTSLASYIGAHPDAYCPPEEIHYFDRHLDRGPAWYGSCFAAAPDGAKLGETTPEYMYLPSVPPLIGELLPDVRAVVILRQPVDRAYSHYWHNRTRGHEDLEFEAAVRNEPRRRASARDLRLRARFSYLDRGRYSEQLRRLHDFVPRDRVHVLLTDDMRDDRMSAVQAIYRFLGLDPDVVPGAVQRERNRFVTYRSQRARPLIRRLPRGVREAAGRLNVRYTTYPPLDPMLRAALTEDLSDELDALSSMLDRDLSDWRAPG